MSTKILIVLTAVLSFFAPIQFIVLSIGLAIFADTVTAVSLLETKFTSKRLRNGLLKKMLWYQSAMLLFFIVDYSMVNDALLTVFSVKFALSKIVGLFLVGIEIVSIDEKIRNKYGDDKGIINRFKKFLKSVKSVKDEI